MWDLKFMKKWVSIPKKLKLFVAHLISDIELKSQQLSLYKQILFVCLLVLSVHYCGKINNVL